MTLEFIGMVQPRLQSEIHPADKSVVLDKGYLKEFAQAHEASGFDRVLIGYYADAPDGFQLGGYIAAHTERLGLLLAHRPGFVAPTVAARALATLDQVSDGRLAVHIISGGDDADQRRDGDFLDKAERYARTDEYVGILKALWTGQGGVNHHGRFYQFENAATAVRTVQKPHIPIYFGGASQAAIEVSARHADVFALWGETHAQVKEITGRVRAAAAAQGRQIRFSLSFRPILAATEEAAWARAAKILEQTKKIGGQGWLGPNAGAPANEGSRRLLEAAGAGRAAGPLPLDRHRRGHRRARQYHRFGRHARAGGGGAAGLLEARGLHLPDPGVRSAGGCGGLRQDPVAADPGADRPGASGISRACCS
jgi:alkanesulfonate monooxygenase